MTIDPVKRPVTTADSIELKRFRALKTLRDFDSVRAAGGSGSGSHRYPSLSGRSAARWAAHFQLSAQGRVAVGEASKSLTRLYGIHMRHGPDAAYLATEDEARVARRASALTAASSCHE